MNTYIVQEYTIWEDGKAKQYTPLWLEVEAEDEAGIKEFLAEKHECSMYAVEDIYSEKVLEDDEEYYGCIAKRVPIDWVCYFINGETEGIDDEDWEEIKALEEEYTIDDYLRYSLDNPEFCWSWGGRSTCLVLARPREK